MGLEELIQDVEQAASSEDPLDRLATAVLRHYELTQQADQLLDHFVLAARDAGCSWAQIGETLGVTKQAAQQRHRPEKAELRGLFGQLTSGHGLSQRFTPRVRTAIEKAGKEAREMRHPFVGTEHLLLGLLADSESIAGKVLIPAGVDDALVRSKILEIVGEGGEEPGQSAFSGRSVKSLELALQEAMSLGHNYIGTEHVLLGIMRTEGLAAKILHDQGLDLKKTRDEVVQLLSDYMKGKKD